MGSALLPREHVTGAAYGDDAARLLRILLDRRADAGNVHIHRTVEGFRRLPLEEVHQRVARHDAAGMVGKRAEQGELVAGEHAVVAVEPRAPRRPIDLEPAEPEQ